MSDGDQKAVRITISGKVQGVCYRAWTVREAEARNIDGWVRNRENGTVEALFVGPATLVDEMVACCYQGPPAAEVINIEVSPSQGITSRGFFQKPTV